MVKTPVTSITFEEYLTYDDGNGKISVLLLEEGLYEETVFTTNQQIISQTFPELAIAVEQILAAGNLS
ncbi:hypothetical protein [Nodularia sp. UHCC 0506]|uniref:hypothetical protein n=1 Tax=Nodularia sp. UHCC 0506 TaxID=3110243 RepID=UPI003A4C64EC